MYRSSDLSPDVGWEEEQTRVSRPEYEGETEATIRMDRGRSSESRPAPESETVVMGGPPPSFVWLVVCYGSRAGRIFNLDPKGTSIGRDPQSDIILDDEAISRQHAKVKAEKGEGDRDQYFIWDLASANDTFVNGERVVKQALQDGDEVKIGQTILVFKRV